MFWRRLGREAARGLFAYVRVWTAGTGGVLGGLGAIYLLIEERGSVGSVPGILCLVLAACALIAAYIGMRDIRDIRGWAGAVIALVLGFATFVAVAVAAGSATGT